MYADQEYAKMQAEKQYLNNASPTQPHPVDQCGQAAMGQTPSRPGYSLRDEAQKRAMHHHEQADKAQQSAVFLSQHPEFEEFIRLVRSGALQF